MSEVVPRRRKRSIDTSQGGQKSSRARSNSASDFEQLKHLIEFLKDQHRTKDKLLIEKDLKIEEMQSEKKEMQQRINLLEKHYKQKELDAKVNEEKVKQYES